MSIFFLLPCSLISLVFFFLNSAHDVDLISLDKDPPRPILEKHDGNIVKNNDEGATRSIDLFCFSFVDFCFSFTLFLIFFLDNDDDHQKTSKEKKGSNKRVGNRCK